MGRIMESFEISMVKLLAILLFVTLCGCGAASDDPPPPNILWITSEDNSPFLGAYGDDYADTPNIDRLAERGTVYENACTTTPVRAPSRFPVITGAYANSLGTGGRASTDPN